MVDDTMQSHSDGSYEIKNKQIKKTHEFEIMRLVHRQASAEKKNQEKSWNKTSDNENWIMTRASLKRWISQVFKSLMAHLL